MMIMMSEAETAQRHAYKVDLIHYQSSEEQYVTVFRRIEPKIEQKQQCQLWSLSSIVMEINGSEVKSSCLE